MKVNKAKKRTKGAKGTVTVRQDFSPALYSRSSASPLRHLTSLFKREWPNALKECDLSDSHGATAKYSPFLSHVLNVYSIAPAPDQVDPSSDDDDAPGDTVVGDTNSLQEQQNSVSLFTNKY
ncbi:hypothetical protein QOT17_009021 [Balamuthia mandrillaris]